MKESHLQDIQGEMLQFRVVRKIRQRDLQEAVHSRVTDSPTEGLQYMPLHLQEHVIVIERATHRLQLFDCWYVLFLVTVLGSNQERCTTDELVMALVHYSLRTVAIQEVDCQEQCRRKQLESAMGFDQEVEKVGTHVPLNLSLDINRLDVRKGSKLVGQSQR